MLPSHAAGILVGKSLRQAPLAAAAMPFTAPRPIALWAGTSARRQRFRRAVLRLLPMAYTSPSAGEDRPENFAETRAKTPGTYVRIPRSG